jgi:hypothetical protein
MRRVCYYYYYYYYLTAVGLTPVGSSIHLHTNIALEKDKAGICYSAQIDMKIAKFLPHMTVGNNRG